MDQRRQRLLELAAWVVIVAYAFLCLYGVFSPWQFGHNGFNGAAFSQGARNALRFGIGGQALYYTGLGPPGPDLIYTHHPQLLHWHLIAVFRLFGEKPWIGRMIPALYSIASAILVHRMARRLWDPRFALIAVFLWATVPLHSIFANMIDHEQGAIFWLLSTVWLYVSWLEDHARGKLLGLLATISIAAQFDWPAYYIAFFLALHALARGLSAGRPVLRWRPEWTFLVAFSAVVLANFGGFFLWVASVRGTLSEMGHAYALRTGEARGYLPQLASRMLDLHGPMLLLLTALWIPWILVRLKRREATARDLVPAVFLGAQLIHSTVFKTAGHIHSYWTYFLGPATAFGGASVVVAFLDALALKARWVRVATALVLFVGAIDLSARAYFRLRWGFSMGTGSYLVPYPDQHPQIRFAQWLGRTFSRESTRYVVHPSMGVRIEFHWYLDAPFEDRGEIEPSAADYASGKRVIALVDVTRSGARATLARLLRGHPAWIFDRRFVAVEISAHAPHVEAFRSVPIAQSGLATAVHRWFVDPLHPAMDYVPDDPVAAAAGLDYPVVSFEGELSARSGTRVEWDCPIGASVIGFEAVQSADRTLARVRFLCGGQVFTPWWGGRSDKPVESSPCPVGEVAVGLEARAGRFVDAASLLCAPLLQEGNGFKVSTLAHASPAIGGSGGNARQIMCPGGMVVRGVRVRTGALVDSLGIACGNL